MQANWSLILNVLLLIGVVVAISRMIKARREVIELSPRQPSLGQVEVSAAAYDDIIAVRKVQREVEEIESVYPAKAPMVDTQPQEDPIRITPSEPPKIAKKEASLPPSIMMFLLAKDNRQLAGYELLQTVLAAGLRFGEGHLFHRHQYPNGQGPVLCSLAAATPTGVFDLQNIGAFSVHGLCLFMQTSGNSAIDAERFSIMLDTAKLLSEGLNTHLLDDRRKPVDDDSIQRYYQLLNIDDLGSKAAEGF